MVYIVTAKPIYYYRTKIKATIEIIIMKILIIAAITRNKNTAQKATTTMHTSISQMHTVMPWHRADLPT